MKTIKIEGANFWNVNPCGGQWENYHEFLRWIQRTEPYIFSILNCYDWRTKSVLEVGCGQGATLNYLPSLGAKVFGLDMSLHSIAVASAGAVELGHEAKIAVLQADAEMIPFKSESFDAIISIGVLHHTPDTAGAVREVFRLLKPGGQAVVMLYRSGNPKWWLTCLLRSFSWLADKILGENAFIANRLRSRQQLASLGGTALLELFGVPILKAFSNRQSRKIFSDFASIKITNYSPGFRRLGDVIPLLRRLAPLLEWLDRTTQNMWGFYQVIEAKK